MQVVWMTGGGRSRKTGWCLRSCGVRSKVSQVPCGIPRSSMCVTMCDSMHFSHAILKLLHIGCDGVLSFWGNLDELHCVDVHPVVHHTLQHPMAKNSICQDTAISQIEPKTFFQIIEFGRRHVLSLGRPEDSIRFLGNMEVCDAIYKNSCTATQTTL